MKKHIYDVCIVGGLGHVGLPLGISLARESKKVILYDIDKKAGKRVREGKMPFKENGAEPILKNVLEKNLFISSDKKVMRKSHFIIIIIGTPVDEHLDPKYMVFKRFIDGVIDMISDDQHVILRSTVFPGTTEKVKRYFESKGKKPKLSFCPERIAEGKAMEELCALPQIVSAFDEVSKNEAAELFSVLTKDILFLSPLEAELAKIFTNVWRYIQFAISNQFYEIAAQHNVDFYKVYDAITYKYPRASSFPPAGFAAGPCLFKDTMQLAAFSNNSFFLGHAAMLINEGMPYFIIQRLKDKYSLKDKTVGIIGMAFKANSDDNRESLAYKLKKILEVEAEKVLCTDVYIKEDGFVSLKEAVKGSDIIILGVPHKEYATLHLENKIVVDVWNYYKRGGLF
ncbi:UDP-glucose/GDP-mannose dehydrogenase [Candidatus Omnitrophus magneticus]|uniref:UDP-glucose/GDP-mannose dehydrogenase n=1 Tax=Candidatus Omnitrophus magneticus TaxID=1609969 RepID=A0A0F0CPR9_9BACT|nr:UDP-glucose/GDP-mannose dehydrogenase [Candidatus Omnitrophus magneticus]